MRRISRAFFTGLAALLPIVVTVYILLATAAWAEAGFRALIRATIGERYYVGGMGLLAALVLTLLLGLALQAWIVRKCFGLGERLLRRMPVVSIIYGAARDLIAFFSDPNRKAFTQTVIVTLGDYRQIGFITREDFAGCPDGMADAQTLAVFLPNSFETGGVTILVPRAAVRLIDMSFPEAMRFALTAGTSLGKNAER